MVTERNEAFEARSMMHVDMRELQTAPGSERGLDDG
jgi:hypothetical protein